MGFLDSLPIIGDVLKFVSNEEDRNVQENIAEANRISQEAAQRYNREAGERSFAVSEDQRRISNEQWERSFGQSISQFEKNLAKQEEFAKMGIQWKVQDALAAGLHPLYALGGGASFSPASIVGASSTGGASPPTPRVDAVLRQATGSSASNLAKMGQDVTRSMMATQTAEDRVVTRELSRLSLERAGLENELLRSQIAKTSGAQIGAPMPSDDPSSVQVNPLKITVGPPGDRGVEPAPVPEVGYGWGQGMARSPMPSKDAQERMEDNWLAQASWMYRNQFLPSFGFNQRPPPYDPGPGMHWYFDPVKQEYYIGKDLGGWGKYTPFGGYGRR